MCSLRLPLQFPLQPHFNFTSTSLQLSFKGRFPRLQGLDFLSRVLLSYAFGCCSLCSPSRPEQISSSGACSLVGSLGPLGKLLDSRHPVPAPGAGLLEGGKFGGSRLRLPAGPACFARFWGLGRQPRLSVPMGWAGIPTYPGLSMGDPGLRIRLRKFLPGPTSGSRVPFPPTPGSYRGTWGLCFGFGVCVEPCGWPPRLAGGSRSEPSTGRARQL